MKLFASCTFYFFDYFLDDSISSGSQSDIESEHLSGNENDHIINHWGMVVGNKRNFTFEEDVGLTQEVIDLKNEDEFTYFRLFLDDEIMHMIVKQTNTYANQIIVKGITAENIGPSSRLNKWKETDVGEMFCFLGILIWMGLDKKPKLADYWRNNDLYWSKAAGYMSRNRFEILLRMWHFADNDLCQPGDRLHKIQPIVELLNAKFKRVVQPDENLCIDETMVPFRGRLKFRQYIKGKRHKFGIKLFKLCLSGGYTHHCKIYCGADKTEGMSVATKVVFELMADCLDKGATLYTDNWYTSIELAEKLLDRNTHLVGTLRKNRKGIPKEVLSTKLKKGEIIGREKNGIVILKWMDKREVLMLTTKHQANLVEVPGRVEGRTKPEAVIDYNNAKSFIDVSDQLSSYSTSVRRSIKWYKKVAFELLTGASVVNAHYLYNRNESKKYGIIDFKEKLCLKMLSMGKKNIIPPDRPSAQAHKFIQIEKKSRCVICYQRNKDRHDRKYAISKTKQVTTKCQGCIEKFLCLECFFGRHNILPKMNN